MDRPWEGVHSAWATVIAQQLNDKLLPPEYFAMPHVRLGAAVEADEFDVRVFRQEGGPRLAAAIELVSPANKDRPSHRQAFAGKCAGYLRQGVGLVVVDIVSDRHDSLHRELVALLELNGSAEFDPPLYAVSYRTAASETESRLEMWPEPLAIGRQLPTLPLWLSEEKPVPLDLEQSYQTACRILRIES